MQCMKVDKDISGLQIKVCNKITILISQPKLTLWILSSFEHPKQMFKWIDKKLLTILSPEMFIWRPEIRTKDN